MKKFQHMTIVLRFKEKALALTRKGVLQGIAEEDEAKLEMLGKEGWELVSTVPFSTGGTGFLSSAMKTDSVLAFLKRED
jgi:hypothetical protein